VEDAPLPATAQGIHSPTSGAVIPLSNTFSSLVASQKAKYLASKLNKLATDKECSKPFVFHDQGSLAYIGNWFVFILSIR
jgi:hypothetical protein